MIIEIIEAEENEYIQNAKFLDNQIFLVHSLLYPENIQRVRKYCFGEIIQEVEFKREHRTEVVLIDEAAIRVFTQREIRLIDFDNNTTHIPIINPHLKIGDRNFSHYVHAASISKNEYLVSIQKPGYGDSYYARYFSILKLQEQRRNFPFLKRKLAGNWIAQITEPSCDQFSPLYYNTGFHAKLPQDWLSIISIGCSDNHLYFYSNGGSSTRTKSGPRFECSEIGILNKQLEVIRVEKVQLGIGQFTSNNKCFIQQEYKNERNLHIYYLDDFHYDTIRTTPKTHLGRIKRYAKADLRDNHLLMYDFKNVTLSEVKRK